LNTTDPKNNKTSTSAIASASDLKLFSEEPVRRDYSSEPILPLNYSAAYKNAFSFDDTIEEFNDSHLGSFKAENVDKFISLREKNAT